ncbi:hypothetical protein COL41_27330 [Bacillus mycoides]|nr:hypothetical protein TU70_04930 [Bacillus mycoides]PGU31996.1 hypothetical protein COD66_22005 [Bacillus cereus]TXR74914.1 hypothetical protein DN408_22280 [Bacillus sp. AR13-1]OOR16108.1 hypothetical protein BW891_23050 [Bacillus mycoides]OOR55175.1 hypothetical protein BGP34_24450 [Bacillus mycoides]
MVYFIHSHAKDVKTFENLQSVRYGNSTVAHEPIWSVVGVVMTHRNLARQRYQKWASPLAFGSKNPADVSQLAPLGVGVSNWTRFLTSVKSPLVKRMY